MRKALLAVVLVLLGCDGARADTVTVYDVAAAQRTVLDPGVDIGNVGWGADGTVTAGVVLPRRVGVARLTGPPAVLRRFDGVELSLAPDGRTVAERTRFGRGAVRLVDVASGAELGRVPYVGPERVLTRPGGDAIVFGTLDPLPAVWSGDGARLALTGPARRRGPSVLRVLDVRTGEVLCRARGEDGAAFDATGERLLVTGSRLLDVTACTARDLEAPNPVTDTAAAFAGDAVVWMGKDALAVGGGPVLPAGGRVGALAASPDGRRVAYQVSAGRRSGVAVIPAVPPLRAPFLVTRNREAGPPHWSPDGARIAWATRTAVVG